MHQFTTHNSLKLPLCTQSSLQRCAMWPAPLQNAMDEEKGQQQVEYFLPHKFPTTREGKNAGL